MLRHWWLLVLFCAAFSDAASILPASLGEVHLRDSYHPSTFPTEQLFTIELIAIVKLVTKEHLRRVIKERSVLNYRLLLERRLQMFFPESKLMPLFKSGVEAGKDHKSNPIIWSVSSGQSVRAGQLVGETGTGRKLYSNVNGFLVIFPAQSVNAVVMALPSKHMPAKKEAIKEYLQRQRSPAESRFFARSQKIPCLKCYYPNKNLPEDKAAEIFRLVLAYIEEQLKGFRAYHQKIGTSPEQFQSVQLLVSEQILHAFYPEHEKQVIKLEVGTRISRIAARVGQLVHAKDVLCKYTKQRRCMQCQSSATGFVYQISASTGTLKHPNVLTILKFPAEPANVTGAILEWIADLSDSDPISTPMPSIQDTDDGSEGASSLIVRDTSSESILGIRNFHPAYLGGARFAQVMQLLSKQLCSHVRRMRKTAEVTKVGKAELSCRIAEMMEKFWKTAFPQSTRIKCTLTSAGMMQAMRQKAYSQTAKGAVVGSILKSDGKTEPIVAPCDGFLLPVTLFPGNVVQADDTAARFQCFSKDEPDVVDDYFIRHGTQADEYAFLLRFKKAVDEAGFEEARRRYINRVDCYEFTARWPASWSVGRYEVIQRFHPVTQMFANGETFELVFPFAFLVAQPPEVDALSLAVPSTARICIMNQ